MKICGCGAVTAGVGNGNLGKDIESGNQVSLTFSH